MGKKRKELATMEVAGKWTRDIYMPLLRRGIDIDKSVPEDWRVILSVSYALGAMSQRSILDFLEGRLNNG